MRSFFYFSHPERVGILVLCTLLLLLLLFPRMYGRFFARPQALPWDELEVDTLPTAAVSTPMELVPDSLFAFDPNRTEKEALISLGLEERLARRLINYRKSGGRFYKPEDLLRIYGMDSMWYQQVVEYVQIEGPPKQQRSPKNKYPGRRRYTPDPVDINTADQAALQSLPGIGTYRAERIVRFRDKLGGFYSLDQVGQTYGLPDSVFQEVRPYLRLDTPIRKIRINHCGVEELADHPYLRWHEARQIVNYRTQHGPFVDPGSMVHLKGIPEDRLKAVIPYFDFCRDCGA